MTIEDRTRELAKHISENWAGKTVASAAPGAGDGGEQAIRVSFMDGTVSTIVIESHEAVSVHTLSTGTE